jgi:hypothetical protein
VGGRLGSCPNLSTGWWEIRWALHIFQDHSIPNWIAGNQQVHFSQEDVIAGCFGASFFSKSSGIGTTQLPQDSAASKWICQVSIPWRCHVTGDVPYGSDIVLWIQCRSRQICGYTAILVGGLEHEFYFSIYWE